MHPNSCGLLHTFESPGQLQLVVELCRGGDLQHMLDRRGALSEEEVRHVTRQLCEVRALHAHTHALARTWTPTWIHTHAIKPCIRVETASLVDSQPKL